MTKTLTLNKSNIKDLVCEARMLKEFSSYGCEEKQGRIISYNPFTKKCIDITDYEGPDDPNKGLKPSGPKEPSYTFSKEGAQQAALDASGLMNIEGAKECWEKSPFAFIFGVLTGGATGKYGPHKVAFKLALEASSRVTATKGTLKTYSAARKAGAGVVDASWAASGKAWSNLKKNAFAAGAIWASMMYFNLTGRGDEWEERELAQKAGAPVTVAVDAIGFKNLALKIDEKLGQLDDQSTVNCAIAAFAGASLLTAAVRTGKFLHAKEILNKIKGILQERFDNITKNSKDLEFLTVIRGDSRILDELDFKVQKALRSSIRQSPIKIVKDSTGAPVVQLNQAIKDLGEIRIPWDNLDDKQKKAFANFKHKQDNEAVLNVVEMERQLTKDVQEAVQNASKRYQKDAISEMDKPEGKALKQAVRALAGSAGDSLSKRQNLFFWAGRLYDDLIESSTPKIKRLKELSDQVDKDYQSLNQNIIKNKDFDKAIAEELKLNQDGAYNVASKLYNRLKKQGIIDENTSEQKLLNYLNSSKQFMKKEEELLKEFTAVQEVLKQESKFADMFGKGGNNKKPLLSDFMGTNSGSGLKKFSNKLKGIVQNLKRNHTRLGTKKILYNVLDEIFYYGGTAAMYVGFKVFVNKAGLDIYGEKVIEMAEEFKKKLRYKDYKTTKLGDPYETFDVDKILDKFKEHCIDDFKTTDSPGDPTGLGRKKSFNDFIKGTIEELKKSKKVEEHFNDDKIQLKTSGVDLKVKDKELQEAFSKLIKSQYKISSIKTDPEKGQKLNQKENKEVLQMSKKDIRQLVAEVLNENYSKYPYNSNEPSMGEPDEDYMVEWKALVDEVCNNKKKNIDGDPNTFDDPTIEVAKILVKDQDLFRDVLEMAGSNKSIGVEIMQQLKAAREKKNLDKELDA